MCHAWFRIPLRFNCQPLSCKTLKTRGIRLVWHPDTWITVTSTLEPGTDTHVLRDERLSIIYRPKSENSEENDTNVKNCNNLFTLCHNFVSCCRDVSHSDVLNRCGVHAWRSLRFPQKISMWLFQEEPATGAFLLDTLPTRRICKSENENMDTKAELNISSKQNSTEAKASPAYCGR